MLNLDSKTKSKLALMATLLAPVLAVQGVRVGFGRAAAPAGASAAAVQPAAASPVAAEPEKALTAGQSKAKNWLGSHTRTLHGRSPMDRADPAPVEVVAVPSVPNEPAKPASVPVVEGQPKGLVVTGMIAGGTDGLSLTSINHHVYRIGDTVTGSWKVSAIDTRKRLVTLTGPEGLEMELAPMTPSLER